MNTATVGLAVTPVVVSTLLSHYLNRKPRRQRPTAHLSYDEGLNLIRTFLVFASHHTVEELQAFTAQWVPHPQWVKLEELRVPDDYLARAASLLEDQLGPEGVRRVGGRRWWQWRKPDSPLRAEWIEMRSDYHERRRVGDPGNRVILYVHGGAYFFGSVDEHRYQMQRHARKLKGRVFAPRYRLSPQFPFPCGLQDCLAAYLFLLTHQDPSTIVLAGDSAGGGMVLSILVTLRDRGVPLPAGAVLISPWVDLTHSFPSVAGTNPFDYIPQAGFHHKPSLSWPPPGEVELDNLKKLVLEQKAKQGATLTNGAATAKPSDGAPTVEDVVNTTTRMSLVIDGKDVEIREQIQMYTTNELLAHPLVSPAMQPTLGGLPPLLIMVGSGEILRDEQIYLAHKCANPAKYLPPDALLTEKDREQIARFKPTDVQLQVWDDLCHVAPTLSFTRPAKYMYRSVAQFNAWALARAQRTGIDILDDDDISVISTSESDNGDENGSRDSLKEQKNRAMNDAKAGSVGKAGDPLPPFKNHMIRQRVTRHGDIFPLPPAEELAGCTMDRDLIGVIKQGPVKKWLDQRKAWDTRFAAAKSRVHNRRLRDMVAGFEGFGEGELPPPSALAGRRKLGAAGLAEQEGKKKKKRSYALAMWSGWGSKHDEQTMVREQQAEKEPEVKDVTQAEGKGARPFAELEHQEAAMANNARDTTRSRSRRRVVRDESQTDMGDIGAKADSGPIDENTPVAELLVRREEAGEPSLTPAAKSNFLSPMDVPETGVLGKRPKVDGISVPFSLNTKADTASMITLDSAKDHVTPKRPMSPATSTLSKEVKHTETEDEPQSQQQPQDDEKDDGGDVTPKATTTEAETSGAATIMPAADLERPGIETFVTASEELPMAASK